MAHDNSSVHNEQFNSENEPVKNTGMNSSDENEESTFQNERSSEAMKDAETEEVKGEEIKEEVHDTGSTDKIIEEGTTKLKKENDSPDEDKPGGMPSETPGNENNKEGIEPEKPEEEKVDYHSLDKSGLVKHLEKLVHADNITDISSDIEIIRELFYKIHQAEIEETKKHFLNEGGVPEDFKPTPDPLEHQIKDTINKYREHKSELNRKLEGEKMENLDVKNQVIEEIKDLVNRKESINKTFHEFRELQQKWREIGLVPQQNVKGLWESYHLACEMFYDYIHINKELRDLDLKKNLEAKIILCEKAEKLLVEPSVINAFKTLQTFHEQWREIGPVPQDKKAEIWERFKEITSKINKRHHQHFEELKGSQKKNLEEKSALCEKVEEINKLEIDSAKEWEEKSKEIIDIQKVWKTIGFAPKKDNNIIYARFREACDKFFNAKREFFAANKEEQKNNLQLKMDLCVQAEALKESMDWKSTTDTLIELQKKWKKIGPVPRKSSDAVWERFRSACDEFFEKKSTFFSNIDSTYDENLKKKNELIAEIEKYQFVKDVEENFQNINDFQKRWTEIGFVPLKEKEEIQMRYRTAINVLFDKLKVDDEEKNILKYNNKLTEISAKPNASQKLRQEREKMYKRLTSLESDIVLWENNIGFFSNSKNADSLIKDVKQKIENGKKTVEQLKDKIRAIDDFKDENDIN